MYSLDLSLLKKTATSYKNNYWSLRKIQTFEIEI